MSMFESQMGVSKSSTPLKTLDMPTSPDVAEWRRWFSAGQQLRKILPPGFPTIVCLCGSTRFGDAFRDALRNETLAGNIVLSVGLLGHSEGIDMNGPVKVGLDELHKRKIDLADEVLILNVGAYIGSSTRGELEYAQAHGKVIRYLEQPR
jgi:hypothetical protein